MKRSHAIAAIALVALLTGIVVAAALQNAAADPTLPPAAFNVPVACQGDVVTYQYLEPVDRTGADLSKLPAGWRDGDWILSGLYTYSYQPPSTAIDEKGTWHSTEPVKAHFQLARGYVQPQYANNPNSASGSNVESGGNGVIHVRLQDRQVVQREKESLMPFGTTRTFESGRWPWEVPVGLQLLPPGIASQGALLVPGTILSAEAREQPPHSNAVTAGPDSIVDTVSVGTPARLDGVFVVPVVSDRSVVEHRGMLVDGNVVFDGSYASTIRAHVRIVSWFADGEAHPRLVQVNGTYKQTPDPGTVDARYGTGTSEQHVAYQLHRLTVQSAGEPVPWNVHDSATSGGDAARFAPGSVPSDTGSTIVYPLSKALADLKDRQPPSFQGWANDHDDKRLVGAGLLPLTEEDYRLRWYLVWASHDGTGRMVHVDRQTDGTVTTEDDADGPLKMPAFTDADLPDPVLTFGAAESMWRATGGEAAQGPLNLVSWGRDLSMPIIGQGPKENGCRMTAARWVDGLQQPGLSARDPYRLDAGRISLASIAGPQAGCVGYSSASFDSRAGTILEERTSLPFDLHDADWFQHRERERVTLQQAAPGGFRSPHVESVAAASILIFLAALGLYLAPWTKFAGARILLAIPGYSKLRKADLLDNAVRDRLVEAIKADPGVEPTELTKRVGAGWGTVVYHLLVLERSKVVSSLVDGRYRRYFPVGTIDWSDRSRVAVLRNERTKALYDLIHGEPGLFQRELSARLGLSAPGTLWHLERLETVGLVGRIRDGRKVRYAANAEADVPRTYDANEATEVA